MRIVIITLLLASLTFAAIDGAEYSWDVAAASGTGTPLAITGDDTAFVSQRIAVTALSSGAHRLYLRMHDNEFGWGEVNSRVIYKFPAPLSLADSSRLSGTECFMGNDPGIGLGVALAADDGVWDEANEAATAFLEPSLAGRQLLGVRFRDNLGQWSNVTYDTVDVAARLVIHTVGTNVILNWTRGVAGQPFAVYRTSDFDSTSSVLGATPDSTFSDTVSALPLPTRQYYHVTQTRP